MIDIHYEFVVGLNFCCDFDVVDSFVEEFLGNSDWVVSWSKDFVQGIDLNTVVPEGVAVVVVVLADFEVTMLGLVWKIGVVGWEIFESLVEMFETWL